VLDEGRDSQNQLNTSNLPKGQLCSVKLPPFQVLTSTVGVIDSRFTLGGQLMKATTTFALALLTTLSATLPMVLPAKAENPADVKRLLETRECSGCNLAGANLTGAHLLGADLRNANLKGAILVNTNLEGADLTGADLRNANLTGVFASNASLDYTNLSNANLANANVSNANTTGAILTGINIAGAKVFGSGISIGGD
jgi:uncharacterized protein YjbI with pentapeptide repeats